MGSGRVRRGGRLGRGGYGRDPSLGVCLSFGVLCSRLFLVVVCWFGAPRSRFIFVGEQVLMVTIAWVRTIFACVIRNECVHGVQGADLPSGVGVFVRGRCEREFAPVLPCVRVVFLPIRVHFRMCGAMVSFPVFVVGRVSMAEGF